MTTSRPRHGLVVIMTMPADDPALESALVPRLALAGIRPDRVTLISPRGAAPPVFAADHVVLPQIPVGLWPFITSVALVYVILTRRPAAVAAAEEWSALPLSLWPRRLRRWTYLMDKWGLPVEESLLRGLPAPKVVVLRWIERLNVRRADRVACVTRFMAAELRRRGLRAPTIIVPNFVVPEELAAPDRTLPGRLRIAYVGGGQVWQCPYETLELLTRLRAARPNGEFLVATRDPAFAAAAAQRGLSTSTLTRQGAVELTASCSAVVALRRDHPAIKAASPTKIREALAQGTPIITTVDGCEDVERLGELGFACLIDPDAPDVEKITSWLDSLARLGTDELRVLRTEALKVYDLELYRRELALYYREVAA